MRSARRQQHTVRGMLCVQGGSTIRDVHHPQLVTRNRIVQLWLILIICVRARVRRRRRDCHTLQFCEGHGGEWPQQTQKR